MKNSVFVLAVLSIIFLFCLWNKAGCRENMTGYGTISGLAYGNRAQYCWKNMYDGDGTVYCGTIGKVVQ
jgi:hypothetical protein